MQLLFKTILVFPFLTILFWIKKPEQIKKKGTADSKINSTNCGNSVSNIVNGFLLKMGDDEDEE